MKTEMKVLLYIKRSGQDKDGFSPLMGRISVKGRVNSIAQFACKFKIEVQLWNATAQRCTGKSKVATMANREIERVLLLLQKRFNELFDIQDVVTAEEVRNVFQGLAETQDTIMKLYAEHNSDYALRVGVNRAVNTFYQYQNTYRILGAFLKEKYHVSDMPVKQLDESFIEAFDMYMRTTRRFMPRTILGHVNRLKSVMMLAVFRGIVPFSPFKGYAPQKPAFKQMYLTEDELDLFSNTTYDTPNRNFTRDMFLFSCWTGICYCDMRSLTTANLVKADDGSMWIHTERQKTGTPECVRLMEIPLSIIEKYKGMDDNGKLLPMLKGEHEQTSEKDVRDVRHQPSNLISPGTSHLRKHHLPVTGDSDRNRQQNHGASAYHHHAAVCESHPGQDRQGCGLPERCYRGQVLLVGHRHRPVTDSERLQPAESQSEREATGVHN